MSLNLTSPPWCDNDKSPRILLWKGREGEALECGDTRHPATLARSPQALKTPRAMQQAFCNFSRKGPKTDSWDSLNTPDLLLQRAQQGFKGHPCTLRNPSDLDHSNDSLAIWNHRHTQSQIHTMHRGLPGAKCVSGEVSFSSVELGKKAVSVLIPH